jgi:hypothetical protein
MHPFLQLLLLAVAVCALPRKQQEQRRVQEQPDSLHLLLASAAVPGHQYKLLLLTLYDAAKQYSSMQKHHQPSCNPPLPTTTNRKKPSITGPTDAPLLFSFCSKSRIEVSLVDGWPAWAAPMTMRETHLLWHISATLALVVSTRLGVYEALGGGLR